MKRAESKKSHSWWWDSHISPKNSKWLQENLQEMDQHVKRMLKLIEEDADSFAKKAEMYYQKRPELIALVEDFYRMYHSLAERYDHVTGELRRSVPSDLHSQSSGISEVESEPPSAMPSPDRCRPKLGPRAAGFDFFLGGNGADINNNNGCNNKEGDELSTLDSESEDGSSVHNDDERVVMLEVKLREVKEKLARYERGEEGSGISFENLDRHEKELRKIESLAKEDDLLSGGQNGLFRVQDFDMQRKIEMLEEDLEVTLEKLRLSEDEITGLRRKLESDGFALQDLQDQLNSARKEIEVTNLSEQVGEIKATMSNDNKSLSVENERLQGELNRIMRERAYLEENLKEMDSLRQSSEEDTRRARAERAEMEDIFRAEMEQLKADLAEKNERVDELKKTCDSLRLKYEMVMAEKDELSINIAELADEVSSKDNRIDEISKHLYQLHVEHVDLVAGAEVAHKLADKLRSRVRELEMEVNRKQESIREGAEEKREAIRQLCFSLEHYRNGYHRLRQAVIGQKGLSLMAS